MALKRTIPIETGFLNVVFSDATDGNFQIDSDKQILSKLRSDIVPYEWTWFKQVHGNKIYIVEKPGEHAGKDADGSVTSQYDCPLSVTTADCSPVVLVGSNSFAVLHAGWKSLEAGIIERGAEMLKEHGAEPNATLLGLSLIHI